ncbi:MAG: hypothetical protein H0T73_04380 [Ardenticatenales bacterium]|nr:hypothetical protein [Ardenticatenales bacterium]
MAEKNPRRLALILEDLQQELSRWALKASAAINASSYRQRQMREQVVQVQRQTNIIVQRLVDDRETTKAAEEEVKTVYATCEDAKELSHHTLAKAVATLKQADDTLLHWQNELELALAWLKRAEERVRLAEIELAAAQAELRTAQSELSWAENAYRSCHNKGRRKNCNGEAARVQAAQARVVQARHRVHLAEVELAAAKAERERARARVRCCQTAVGYATEALNMATDAHEQATIAVNVAERSLEVAESAQRVMVAIHSLIAQEEEKSEEMETLVQRITVLEDEAQTQHTTASRTEEIAQSYHTFARMELDHRILRLYALDRPEQLG